MKRFLNIAIILLAIVLPLNSLAQSKRIVVAVPGTLSQSFPSIEQASLSNLTIAGALNNVDVRFLRRLCGNDSLFKSVSPALNIEHLDLSKVSFKPDSSSYAVGNNGKGYRITGSHTLPAFLFYGCNVSRVTMPESLDSVGYGALAFSKLKSIEIPNGVYIESTAIYDLPQLTELKVPAMVNGVAPTQMLLPKVRMVRYGDMDYMMSGAFNDLSEIEEIVFDGMIGHIDGYLVTNCPKLRRIIFRGAINTTGGQQFVKDCPLLEEVRFDGLVISSGFGEPVNCPNLKHYTIAGAIAMSGDSINFPTTSAADIAKRKDMVEQLRQIACWQTDMLANPPRNFMFNAAFSTADKTVELLGAAGLINEKTDLEKVLNKAKENIDLRSKLEIIKDSPAYKSASDSIISFTYAQPSDSLLTLSRLHFNLDSIAGNGDDISRIKNLLYWVHDLVKHDGGAAWPDCKFNLREIAQVCHEENRGVNCRFMAMMLTEALLAEGIPARYLTCESKAWDTDSDCHVICVAWSESLDKWVWVDPTFAAYVTDENGLMLHPGEVRYRLQNDLPLILNEDANWNHEVKQTKEYYLDEYMAKNLYIISCNSINQAEPEGNTSHPKGVGVALIPEGSNYTRAQIITTDYDKFWQSPQ